MHPAVAVLEHFDELGFHLLPVVVAPQEERLDGGAQGWIGAVNLFECLAGGAAVEFGGLFVDAEPVAEAGEQWLLQGKVAAKGIDRGDAKLGGLIKEIPAKGLGVKECATGKGLHGEGVVRSGCGIRLCGGFEFGEDAVAHLGGGGLCEGNGDDLAWIFNLREQAEEAASEEFGFAGAGWGLDEDGVRRIEGAFALGLVGGASLGRDVIHWRPPRYLLSLAPLRAGPDFR